MEGVISDVLVHPSIRTTLDAPRLQPVGNSAGASSSACATCPPVRMAPALSPREAEEYQKVCEHEEQSDDQWLTNMIVNQPPESKGPVRGMQIWVKIA